MIDWSAGSTGRRFTGSIRAEFLRYKELAEGAIAQVKDEELSVDGPNGSSSIATICRHVAGNLRSRFTDFQTSDGEKPWRDRESEFERRTVTRAEMLAQWQAGWDALLDALNEVTDPQLEKTVTIRGNRLAIHDALHRALAHVAYHVGQIVYAAKGLRGADWKSLSIPPGESDRWRERPRVH